MREPIREPAPQEAAPGRGPEPLRYPGRVAFSRATALGVPSLVEWAPTWGGMFVSLGILLLISSLGVAIGVGTGATAAGIWGAISVIIGFFVGGWFTGRTLEVFDSFIAAAHGALVWAVTVVFTLVFGILATFLGANALANLGRLAIIGSLLTPTGPAAAPSAAAAASAAVTSSWVTFIILLLSIAAAVLGAIVGNQGRYLPEEQR